MSADQAPIAVQAEGYLYCMSNPSMPDMVKVGITRTTATTPADRAATLFTTGVPTPFKVEFAKKVRDPLQKEGALHSLLSRYHERLLRREFFRCTPADVWAFFELIDGDLWEPTVVPQPGPESTDDEPEAENAADAPFCFTQGARIRNVARGPLADKAPEKIWYGTYDLVNKQIIRDGVSYKSPSTFARLHAQSYGDIRPYAGGFQGPALVEVEVNGQWVKWIDVRHQ